MMKTKYAITTPLSLPLSWTWTRFIYSLSQVPWTLFLRAWFAVFISESFCALNDLVCSVTLLDETRTHSRIGSDWHHPSTSDRTYISVLRTWTMQSIVSILNKDVLIPVPISSSLPLPLPLYDYVEYRFNCHRIWSWYWDWYFRFQFSPIFMYSVLCMHFSARHMCHVCDTAIRTDERNDRYQISFKRCRLKVNRNADNDVKWLSITRDVIFLS